MSPVPIFLFSLLILLTGVMTSDRLEQEKQALVAFMDELTLPKSPDFKYNWDRKASPCSWAGVTCGYEDEYISHLNIPGADLIGQIKPNTIGKLTGLRALSLHDNGFVGPIPPDIAELKSLTHIVLHNNYFSGKLPDIKAVKLVVLNVSNNLLTGNIPPGLSKLTSLTNLSLDDNKLSGQLPEIKADNLVGFNVSFNRLRTYVPKSLSKFPKSVFSNNIDVCGPPFGPCKGSSSSPPPMPEPSVADDGKKDKDKRPLIVGVSVASGLLLVIFICCLRKNMCQKQRKHVPLEALVVERSNKLVLFDHDRNIHDFGLEDLLNGSADQLGNGTVGTSYKQAIKAKTMTVVVKRLRDEVVNEREFETTMQVLGKMKNEYVVPLKGFYCSKYEKWVVYDYMPDGSLSARLHEMSFAGSTSSSRTQLDWEDRKRIALSTAKGLTYLHESGKIVHGNIKSSNILLRQETNYIDASVSDYGLNSLFGESSSLNHSVTGYWAPEVVKTKEVTFKSDVYSFGVLLLELLTGKTPNQTSLIEERLLFSKWVESIVSEKPKHEMFDVDLTRGIDHNIEEMEQLWHIAKDCVSIEPDKRPTMSDVVSTMEGMGLRPSSDDHSKGYDFTPSTDARDTPSTITP